MIGIIIEFIFSWIILKFIANANFEALGLKLTKSRIKNFAIGFLFAALTCSVYHFMGTYFADNSWIANKMTITNVINGLWWTLKSVLFEELIFRGALLYLAIKKIGSKIACLLSAACFGIYHWFSFGAFGSPFQMLIIFLMTGIFGLMLAHSFAKTSSLYLPIGLHLGWNVFNIVVFSNGPLKDQIFIKLNHNRPEEILSLFIFLFQIFALPIFTWLYLKVFESDNKTTTATRCATTFL